MQSNLPSDGKSVLIKDWINPQSNSFSVKVPFITKAHTPNWIIPSVRHGEQGRRKQNRIENCLLKRFSLDFLIPVFQGAFIGQSRCQSFYRRSSIRSSVDSVAKDPETSSKVFSKAVNEAEINHRSCDLNTLHISFKSD